MATLQALKAPDITMGISKSTVKRLYVEKSQTILDIVAKIQFNLHKVNLLPDRYCTLQSLLNYRWGGGNVNMAAS